MKMQDSDEGDHFWKTHHVLCTDFHSGLTEPRQNGRQLPHCAHFLEALQILVVSALEPS